MAFTFLADYGDSGSALGWYDTDKDKINVNLDALFLTTCLDCYGTCGEPPKEYRCPAAIDEEMIRRFVNIVAHECVHKILNVANCELCLKLDNLPNDVLEW